MRADRDDVFEDRSEELDSVVLAKLGAALGVLWSLLLYDALPAAAAWALSAAESLDIFAPFIEAPLQARLGRLGLFLGMVAAVIANESLTRLGRPFRLPHLVGTLAALGVALFPFLAAAHRVPLGLPADVFAVIVSYAYLVLKVTVGILIGATISWILIGHGVTTANRRRP